MKPLLIIIAATLLLSFSPSKKKKFIPPGTVQITETFFADECEVSNLSWIEYEYWTAKTYGKNSKEYLATLPDTLVWRNEKTYNEPYVTYYHRHKTYRDYPVVGISYEQALAFCKWRTERVKSFFNIQYKKNIVINYRLPTLKEWEYLTQNAFHETVFDKKTNKVNTNLKISLSDTDDQKTTKSHDIFVPIKSLPPNYFGIYNMIGNVAEMISEKNSCKGGSWMHPKEDSRPGKNIDYDTPQAWLGFRCVCDYTLSNN
jgi:formylglycine-generating enzyme required for sulfatase activity